VAPSSIYDRITRQHPAYKAGPALGTDIGTRMALDVIWAKRGRQVDAAQVVDQTSNGPARHPESRLRGRTVTRGRAIDRRNVPPVTHS
jgi:hypothetical protein